MSKRLGIVVGHMKSSKGAQAVAPISAQEYDWNTDLAERMVAIAKEDYAATKFEAEIFFRNTGGVRGAYGRAKEWGADATIELHFNAHVPAANGTETLYVSAPSKPFAQVVHAATLSALELKDRGIKTPNEASGGRGYQSLVQMGPKPSIITEPFFGSNARDAQAAHAHKNGLARAQIDAAATYLLKPFDNGDDLNWQVKATTLNVRGGPGVEYEKLEWGPLKLGQKVVLIRRRDPWFLIQLGSDGSKTGYVHSDFLV